MSMQCVSDLKFVQCSKGFGGCRSMYECVHASLTGTELVSTPLPAQSSDPAKKKELQAAHPKAGGLHFPRWKW